MNQTKSEQKILQGYAVSDLHHFAARSISKQYRQKIFNASQASNFLVLCGDIFDFRWSTLSSVKETISKAIHWLEILCLQSPDCRIIYLMGNHDCIIDFKNPLDQLTRRQSNFSWHPAYFLIETTLFLHGDVPSYSNGHDLTRGYLQPAEKTRGVVMNFLYQVLTDSQIIKLHQVLYNQKKSISILYQALSENQSLFKNAITHVYFGHTHIPVSDYNHQGIIFNNLGCAIKGFSFNMQKVNIGVA